MLTIEHPLTGEKLQVANRDFSNEMNWYEAIDACEKLGKGWRLPSMEELEAMYEELHKKGQGNFQAECYWSITGIASSSALVFEFSNGNAYGSGKDTTYYVRAVRIL